MPPSGARFADRAAAAARAAVFRVAGPAPPTGRGSGSGVSVPIGQPVWVHGRVSSGFKFVVGDLARITKQD
eukprot:11203695-Lingulodinium_polyedra.AAC.1